MTSSSPLASRSVGYNSSLAHAPTPIHEAPVLGVVRRRERLHRHGSGATCLARSGGDGGALGRGAQNGLRSRHQRAGVAVASEAVTHALAVRVAHHATLGVQLQQERRRPSARQRRVPARARCATRNSCVTPVGTCGPVLVLLADSVINAAGISYGFCHWGAPVTSPCAAGNLRLESFEYVIHHCGRGRQEHLRRHRRRLRRGRRTDRLHAGHGWRAGAHARGGPQLHAGHRNADDADQLRGAAARLPARPRSRSASGTRPSTAAGTCRASPTPARPTIRRASSSGGARACWAGAPITGAASSLRNGPYDFKPHTRDGLGFDWPMDYEDLAPYYDKVEMLIGVYGANDGLENTPNSPPGVLLPPPKPRVARPARSSSAPRKLGIPVDRRASRRAHDAPRSQAPAETTASGQREGAAHPRGRHAEARRLLLRDALRPRLLDPG